VPTYSTKDFQKIAAAVGVKLDAVIQYRNEFEAAAVWYRSDESSPRRVPPSKIRIKAEQIAAAANKLLRHLKIYDSRHAVDGPGDWTLLEALASTRDSTEDAIIRATERIGRLAEVFDGIDAVELLACQAANAAEDARRLARLTPSGHRGETAENDWTASMMSLYEKTAGRKGGDICGCAIQKQRGQSLRSSDSIPSSRRETFRHQALARVVARPDPRRKNWRPAKLKSIAPFRQRRPGPLSPGRMKAVRAHGQKPEDAAAFAALIALARLLARQAAREWANANKDADFPSSASAIEKQEK
jgi:hypothetical protein